MYPEDFEKLAALVATFIGPSEVITYDCELVRELRKKCRIEFPNISRDCLDSSLERMIKAWVNIRI